MTVDTERRAYIGSYVLESLTTGMYDEPRHALREYVQNAYDAIRRARGLKWLRPADGEIIVRLNERNNSLSISDNGTGISSQAAWEILSSVGASSKNRKEQAGFRGIGRLAGIAYCEHLRFITKYRGEEEETIVSFDCERFRKGMDPERDAGEDVQKLLTQAISDERRSVPPERLMSHYTRVVLEDLSAAPEELKDMAGLLVYLRSTSPVDFDPKWPFGARIKEHARAFGQALEPIKLRLEYVSDLTDDYEDEDDSEVDGEDAAADVQADVDLDLIEPSEVYEVYKPYQSALAPMSRKPVKVTDIRFFQDDGDARKWWGWVGQTQLLAALKDEAAGLRVRVRDIQIDGTSITNHLFSNVRATYGRFNDWYVGEIHVVSSDIIPNARRDGFEDNATWREIQEELLPNLKDLASKSYKASKRRSNTRKLGKAVEALMIEITERLSSEGPIGAEEHSAFTAQVGELRGALLDEASADSISAEDAAVISKWLGSLNTMGRRLDELVVVGSARFSTTASAAEVLEIVFSVLSDMLGPADYRRIRRIIEDRVRAVSK